jgi:hypothetical protein
MVSYLPPIQELPIFVSSNFTYGNNLVSVDDTEPTTNLSFNNLDLSGNLILKKTNANRLLVFDENKKLISSNITPTIAGYIDTSQNIQTLVSYAPVFINNATGLISNNFKILVDNNETTLSGSVQTSNFGSSFSNTPPILMGCINSNSTDISSLMLINPTTTTFQNYACIQNNNLVARNYFLCAFGLD